MRGKSQTGIGGAGLLLISMTARPWRLRGSGAGWRACNGRRHGCVTKGVTVANADVTTTPVGVAVAATIAGVAELLLVSVSV